MEHVLIYWLAPFSGAMCAALAYKMQPAGSAAPIKPHATPATPAARQQPARSAKSPARSRPGSPAVETEGYKVRRRSRSMTTASGAVSSPRKLKPFGTPKQPSTSAKKWWVDDSLACDVCSKSNKASVMLVCDGCDHGFHTFCLTPALKELPKGKTWFCPACR